MTEAYKTNCEKFAKEVAESDYDVQINFPYADNHIEEIFYFYGCLIDELQKRNPTV